jgi:hypothetical protein
MRVLSLLWATAWFSGDSGLFVALTLKSMSLTLKWGVSPFSASALATFARLLAVLHGTDECYRVGQLALKVHNKWGSKENEGFLFLVLAMFVNHLRETGRNQIRSGHSSIRQRSPLVVIMICDAHYPNSSSSEFPVGIPLSALKQDCTALLSSNTSNRLATTCALPVIQLISCLQDRTPNCNPFALSGEIQDESEFTSSVRSERY